VVEVYTKYVPSLSLLQSVAGSHIYHRVGQLLRSYRAGPLPKPFKIIPSLPAWARILALTAPEQWSPHAAHAATRIFISNMKPPQARVFLEGVILGLVRADFEQPLTRKDTRKLSPHLYEALKRALYKPAAFFKGIVFPLLDVSDSLHNFCLWLMWFVLCAVRRVGARSRRRPSSHPCFPKSKCRFCTLQPRSSVSPVWTTQVRVNDFRS
jgi:Bystin